MLSNRWTPSKWSGQIYHATIPNHRNPDKSVVVELEGADNRVYASYRIGSEHIDIKEGYGFPSFEEASQAALLDVQRMFQARRKACFICEFFPYQTDRQIKEAYGVSQPTANRWKSGAITLKRQVVNQILMSLGFRFKGSGKTRSVTLHEPQWEGE